MKKRIVSLGVIVTMGLLAAATTGSSDDEETSEPKQAQTAPTKQAAPAEPAKTAPPPEPDPPFVAVRKEACEKYKAAGNEIKKSAVYAEFYNKKNLQLGELTDVTATVDDISTTTGGGEVLLKLSTKIGTLGNNAFLSDHVPSKRYVIKKRSPVYNAIGELSEGQEVVVSATSIAPDKTMLGEELSLCGDDWLARYTKIEPK